MGSWSQHITPSARRGDSNPAEIIAAGLGETGKSHAPLFDMTGYLKIFAAAMARTAAVPLLLFPTLPLLNSITAKATQAIENEIELRNNSPT